MGPAVATLGAMQAQMALSILLKLLTFSAGLSGQLRFCAMAFPPVSF